jgi:chromosome segregation ATPase
LLKVVKSCYSSTHNAKLLLKVQNTNFLVFLISTLKEEIKAKEDKLERNEQLLATVQTENKKLAEPLRKAREQLVELQRQLGSQEKEKSSLSSAQSKLKASLRKIENLTWEVEVLQQKFDRAVRKYLHLKIRYSKLLDATSKRAPFSGERDEIHSKFSSAILEMQQKSGLKYMILEKKISSMREELNIKEAQLHATSSMASDSRGINYIHHCFCDPR